MKEEREDDDARLISNRKFTLGNPRAGRATGVPGRLIWVEGLR
jgi:hypothetical protein